MSVQVTTGGATPAPAATGMAGSALAVLAGLALVWRRQWPAAVAAATVAASIGQSLLTGPALPVAGWLGIAVAVRHVPGLGPALRAAAAAALCVIAGSIAGAAVHDRLEALSLALSLTVVVLLAAALGRLQAARAEAQRREREAERRRVVADERLSIARDLHDLVGHGLSAIAVQSSTARLALSAGDTDAATRALGAVEDASRHALAEMRQLLGILRHDGTRAEPAPGLDGVEQLAAVARSVGHPVTVDRSGPLDAVPAATQLAAYRIMQEATTNAMRHAPGAPIAITLRADADALAVDVTDGGSSAKDGPAKDGGMKDSTAKGDDTPADGRDDDDGRPRHGLTGLRERVAAAGGELYAGRRTDGRGWRVAARLPYPSDERAPPDEQVPRDDRPTEEAQ
jgi:signal transduction histidine kinase